MICHIWYTMYVSNEQYIFIEKGVINVMSLTKAHWKLKMMSEQLVDPVSIQMSYSSSTDEVFKLLNIFSFFADKSKKVMFEKILDSEMEKPKIEIRSFSNFPNFIIFRGNPDHRMWNGLIDSILTLSKFKTTDFIKYRILDIPESIQNQKVKMNVFMRDDNIMARSYIEVCNEVALGNPWIYPTFYNNNGFQFTGKKVPDIDPNEIILELSTKDSTYVLLGFHTREELTNFIKKCFTK